MLHKWKRFLCQKRHAYLLKNLNAIIYSKYKIGNANELGMPLSKGNREHETIFKKYFKTYHFEKNFYTNYHAIHKLFDTDYQLIQLPKKFYVYDIACGPYTATISLLNFLERNNTLKGKEFSFRLCDSGDLVLNLLHQAVKENSDLFFPIPYFVQIQSEFDVNNWNMSINQCLFDNRWGCQPYPEIKEKQNHDAMDAEGINLIFCSYAGERGEEKFIHCIEKIFSGFSFQQKAFPTYIIYSHYTGKDKIEENIKENIKSFSISNVIQSNEPVPFPSYYYFIFKIEKSL